MKIKALLAGLLLSICGISQAAVSWKATPTPVQGTTTATSAAFTPAASDTLLQFAMDESYNASTLSFGGSTGTWSVLYPYPNGPAQNNATTGNPMALGINRAASATSQTIHATTSGTGDSIISFWIDYSGVVNAHAFMAAASVTGSPFTGRVENVPTGATLVVLCVDLSGSGTISSTGTSRGAGSASGYNYIFADYAGSGGAVTPQCSSGSTGDDFMVVQWVLAPASVPIPVDAAPNNAEGGFPFTYVFHNPIAVGDVLAVNAVGNQSSTAVNPFPLSCTDTINTGSYSAVGTPAYVTAGGAYNGWFGGVYYIVANAAGATGTTVTCTTTAGASPGGFGGGVHIAGWAGTPTYDSGAVGQFTGTGTTQGGTPSTAHSSEFIFAMPWSGGDIVGNVPGWDALPTPTGDVWDTTYLAAVYNNPGTVTFAGPLSISTTWWTATTALDDATGGACTHGGYTSGGALATPNGSSGNYVANTGSFVTPNCSSTSYWQTSVGNFGAN